MLMSDSQKIPISQKRNIQKTPLGPLAPGAGLSQVSLTTSPMGRCDPPAAGPASADWLGADVEADSYTGAPHLARHLTG